MMSRAKLKELRKERLVLARLLTQLEVAYSKQLLTKQEFLDRRFALLGGQFEQDAFNKMDAQIREVQEKNRATVRMVAFFLVIAIILPFINFGDIVSFVIFENQQTAVLPVNQQYVTNATEDLSFISTTSVKINGRIYGQGETWVYLVDGGTQRLVYYADTRMEQGLTGFVTGTPVNNTNTTNETTEVNVTNSTINETNTTIIVNQTNSTNTTVNSTTNTTVNETPIVEFVPEINTDRSTYSIGDNISIEILPEEAQGTIYLHAPSDSYILNEDYWIAQESGDHTLSGLITLGLQTERAETNFYVRSALEEETASFTNACVETCIMQETPVNLVVITKNTILELDSVVYETTGNASINLTNTTNETVTPPFIDVTPEPVVEETSPDPRNILSKCVEPNENQRPKLCFTSEAWDSRFPRQDFTLVNSLGMAMAKIDHQGNMKIKGNLIENSQGSSQNFDFVVSMHDGTEGAWIDVLNGDLYLRGSVVENQDTLMWKSRKDYVVSNPRGMYMAIFSAETGDLFIRGNVIEGGLQ